MNKIIFFITLLFLFCFNFDGKAYEKLKEIKSVNDLLKQGYKLISTNVTVDPNGASGLSYHLQKDGVLVTCFLINPKGGMFTVTKNYCFKP